MSPSSVDCSLFNRSISQLFLMLIFFSLEFNPEVYQICRSRFKESYERLWEVCMQLCALFPLLILIIAHLNKWSVHSNLCKSIIEPLAVNTVHLLQITIRLPRLLVSCTVCQFSFQIQLLYYVKSRLDSDRLINPHWTVSMH